MSLCDRCGNASFLYSCIICGKRVCRSCLVADKKTCVDCVSGRKAPARDSIDLMK